MGFCQNSGLPRHGGKLTQKLGPGKVTNSAIRVDHLLLKIWATA